MARRPPDDDEGSMDSLLDTMMNVVGILILVLVVTQLGVGDAVKRITDEANIDPATLEEKTKELEAIKDERDALLAAMEETKEVTTDAEEQKKQLEELRRQIAEKEKLLAQLEQKQKEEEAKLAEVKRNMAAAVAAKKQIEDNKKEREQLQTELSTTLKEIARLEALLADTPPPQVNPPKVINLPNPRPAPKDAKQLLFLCSQNKVYPLPTGPPLEQLRKAAQAHALQAAMKVRRTFNPVTGEGTDRFLDEFNKWQPLRKNEYFEVKLYNSRSYPRLLFDPKENGGETEKVVKAPKSKFQRALSMIDRNKYYIRFYVCTDSFDIYVTTRRIVTEKGLLAGWEPQGNGYKWSTSLGGKLQFGPRPKPPPPSKTPAKPRPKRSGNVID